MLQVSVASAAERRLDRPLDTVRAEVERHWRQFSSEGHRVLGVAYRDFPTRTRVTRDDESEMIFAGFVVLADPPKTKVAGTIGELKELGIALKIITGDNALIAEHICAGGRIWWRREFLLVAEMREMSASALIRRASEVDVFAEVEPMQKERIILALKKAGNVVGYLGDGINDAPALARGRRRIVSRQRRRCGAGSRRYRPARARSRGTGRGRTRRPPHICQYAQVRIHRDERELRKHVQHGGRLPVSSISSAPAETNSAHQFAHRFSGDDDRGRQRGRRISAARRGGGTSNSSEGS